MTRRLALETSSAEAIMVNGQGSSSDLKDRLGATILEIRLPDARGAHGAAASLQAIGATEVLPDGETVAATLANQGSQEPLMTYAQHQPVSATANAVRALLLGGPAGSYLLTALAWSVGIFVVFRSLAVHRYRRVG
jgi:hypothetical protein